MAENLGTVGVRIEGDWDAFRKDAKRSVADVGKGIAGGITSGVGKAAKGTLKTVGAVAVGVGAIGTAAAGFGVKSAADLETLNIALVQLTGSEEAAKDQFAELSEFAATTPFEMPGLAKAQNALLATGKIGREDVVPTLRGIGDSVAALGGNTQDVEAIGLALQKSFAKGKVELETLNQISERGIPIMGELAAQMGVSEEELGDLISKGEVAPEVLAQAFQDPMGPLANFEGATANLSKSFNGLLSTLKDTVSLGLGQALTPALQKLTPLLADLIPVVARIIESLAGPFGNVLVMVGNLFTSLMPRLEPLIVALGEWLADAITEIGYGIGEVLPELMDLADAVLPLLLDVIMMLLQNGLDILLPVISKLAGVLAEVLPPILEVVAAILDKLLPVFGDLVLSMAESLMPIIITVADMLAGPLGDALLEVVEAILPLLPVIADLVELAATLLVPIIQGISGALATLIGWFAKLVEKVTNVTSSFVDGLGITLEDVKQWFLDLPGNIVSWLAGIPTWLIEAGKDLIRGFWDGLKSMGSWLKDKIVQWAKDHIPGPIKWALGINSPSKLMMGVGSNVGEGLALGILGAEREVARASSRLAAAASVQADGAYTGALGGASQSRLAPVVMTFNAPVGGSMAEFAREVEQQRALTARFA